MLRWFALIFLVVPLVELWLLLRVGDLVGLWPTIGLVIATALFGAWLVRREGLRVFREWRRALAEMRLPEEGITAGLLVLVGAVMLATPGVLTDAAGIALLVPASRRVIARAIERWVEQRLMSQRGVFDVRVITPRGAYARRRVVDVDGKVVQDSEVRVARSPAVSVEDVSGPRGSGEPDVIEGQVVDVSTRRLGGGD